jgi:hypothetical protein
MVFSEGTLRPRVSVRSKLGLGVPSVGMAAAFSKESAET